MSDRDAAERADARQARRRLLNLGEFVAIVAVAISGLTFWNSYQERTSAETARVSTEQKEARADTVLLLVGKPMASGSDLAIAPANAGQILQTLSVALPRALNVPPIVSTGGNAQVSATTFSAALKQARKQSRDDDTGGLTLPVLITTQYFAKDRVMHATAIYNLGYEFDRHLFGSSVKLTGLALGERTQVGRGQSRIDALWQAQHAVEKPTT